MPKSQRVTFNDTPPQKKLKKKNKNFQLVLEKQAQPAPPPRPRRCPARLPLRCLRASASAPALIFTFPASRWALGGVDSLSRQLHLRRNLIGDGPDAPEDAALVWTGIITADGKGNPCDSRGKRVMRQELGGGGRKLALSPLNPSLELAGCWSRWMCHTEEMRMP